MVMGNNKSATTKHAGEPLAILIVIHTDVMVHHRLHHLLEHVHGFTRSHWMPPSGKCLRCIALAAVMVNKFVETTPNTNKTQLLPSNYGTF